VVHPGWADTPGVHSGLPTFTKVVGPLFRTPEVGADTAVWLAGQPDGEPEGGQLWLDGDPVASTGSRGPTSPKPSSRPT